MFHLVGGKTALTGLSVETRCLDARSIPAQTLPHTIDTIRIEHTIDTDQR